jgi:hypothetical protein
MALALRKAREEVGDLSPKAPIYRQEHFYRHPEAGGESAPSASPKSSFASKVKARRSLNPLAPPPINSEERSPNMTVLGNAPSHKSNDMPPSRGLSLPHPKTDVFSSLTTLLENFTRKFDDRIKALESKPAPPATETIISSVVSKMNEQRKRQAAVLSRRVKDIEQQTKTNPVTVIIAKMMEGIVDATINNKPGPLLRMVTDLYNQNPANKAKQPLWDGSLQAMGDLALGLTNVDNDNDESK